MATLLNAPSGTRRPSDRYFESELEGPVRLQVVAGPCNHNSVLIAGGKCGGATAHRRSCPGMESIDPVLRMAELSEEHGPCWSFQFCAL